jgi:hypothetical protein
MTHRLKTAEGRIEALTGLAEYLEKSLQQIFTGEAFTRYRQCLDDIAKETGGRKQAEPVTWKVKVIAALKDGRIKPKDVSERFGDGLAAELFQAAGVAPDNLVTIYLPDNGR